MCWWLNLPNGQWKGGIVRDLVRRIDLDPYTVGTSDYRGALGRPGGWGAWGFDSVDGKKFSTTTEPLIENMPSMTLMAWVYATGNPTSSHGRIISKRSGSSSDDYHIALSDSRKPVVRWFRSTGTNYTHVGALTVATGEWTHICGMHDGDANEVRVYVNGVQDGSLATVGVVRDSDQQICLGGHHQSATRYFVGHIDDARIYNRAITDEQLNAYIHESRQGYPNILNWVDVGGIVAAAAASTIPVLMNSYRQRRVA